MALGALPQTPGLLRRKSELLGAPPPDPRWGSAPDPVGAPPHKPLGAPPGERGLGRSPSGGLGAEPPAVPSCGEAAGVWGGAPAGVWGRSPQQFALVAEPPRGLGRSPKSHGPPLLAAALPVLFSIELKNRLPTTKDRQMVKARVRINNCRTN